MMSTSKSILNLLNIVVNVDNKFVMQCIDGVSPFAIKYFIELYWTRVSFDAVLKSLKEKKNLNVVSKYL